MNKGVEIYSWFYCLSLFVLIGLIAYLNQNIKAQKEPDNKMIFDALGKWHKKYTYLFACSLFLIFLIIGIIDTIYNFKPIIYYILLSSINLVFILFTIYRSLLWKQVFLLKVK